VEERQLVIFHAPSDRNPTCVKGYRETRQSDYYVEHVGPRDDYYPSGKTAVQKEAFQQNQPGGKQRISDEQMVDPRGTCTRSSKTSGRSVVVYDPLYFPSR